MDETNKIYETFQNTANSIRVALNSSDKITPEKFASNIDSIKALNYSHVYIGTDKPDAAKYKYWFNVDAPNDTPIKHIPRDCVVKIFNTLKAGSEDTINFEDLDVVPNSTSAIRINVTKDYLMPPLSSTSRSASSITVSKLNNTYVGTYNFIRLYDFSSASITLTKTDFWSDVYTSGVYGAIYLFSNNKEEDNYCYLMYPASSSTLKVKRINLDDLTDVITLGTIDAYNLNITNCTFIDDTHIVLVAQSYSSSKYTIKFYLVTITDSSISSSLRYTYTASSRSDIEIFGYYVNLSGIETSNDTIDILDLNSGSIKTVNNTRRTYIDNYLKTLDENNYLYSLRKNKDKIQVLYKDLKSRYFGYAVFTFSFNGDDFTTELDFILPPSQLDNQINAETYILSYNKDNKVLNLYFNESTVRTIPYGIDSDEYLALPDGLSSITRVYSIKYNSSSIYLPAADILLWQYSGLTDTLVLPILSISSEEFITSRGLMKFMLIPEADAYTTLALSDKNYPYIPRGVYNKKYFDIYRSDGEDWLNSIDQGDDDFIENAAF